MRVQCSSNPLCPLVCIRLCPICHSRERDSSRNDVYTDAAQCLQRRPDQGYGCRSASHYALAGAGGPGECHSLPCIGGSQYDPWASYAGRSEESSVGKECVCTCRSRWSTYH